MFHRSTARFAHRVRSVAIHGCVACLLSVTFIGCTAESNDNTPGTETSNTSSQSTNAGPSIELINADVEIACGECQFEMEGITCDLAVRFDDKSYFVDGFNIDDLGDAHADDGLCNAIRRAKVTGRLQGDRFIATAIELLPMDAKGEDDSHEGHDHG